jgi:hypothetical protein
VCLSGLMGSGVRLSLRVSEERVNLSLTNSGPSRTVPYGRAVPIGELVGTNGLGLPLFTDKRTISEPDGTSLEWPEADLLIWRNSRYSCVV